MPSAAPRARRSRIGAVLPESFYARDTETVARELLGAVLRCRTAAGVASGRIVETEAYVGEHDAACHAAAGLTARTRWLYGPPGRAYVYFIYGMYWCFNTVTRPAGFPSAVLVRALEPLEGERLMRQRRPRVRDDRQLANGPGKLCTALGIDGDMNGLRLYHSVLTIHRGRELGDSEVLVTPRIGIRQAADWPLRWVVKDSPFRSR